MEKFNFENNRDALAKKLRNLNKTDKAGARELLKSEKQTLEYQQSKKLHRIKSEFSEEIVDEALNYPEQIDNPGKWSVEDVSDEVPEKFKILIDKSILRDINEKTFPGVEHNESRWAIESKLRGVGEEPKLSDSNYERELFDREIDNFRDKLLEGRLLDRHNLNHLVLGQGGNAKHFQAKPFDRHSVIELSSAGEHSWSDGFWTNTAYGPYNDPGRPAVIFSPENLATRYFFEHEMYPDIQELKKIFLDRETQNPGSTLERFKKMIVTYSESYKSEKFFRGFSVASFQGDADMARLLFLAKLPLTADISYVNKESGGAIFFPFEEERVAAKRKRAGDRSKVAISKTWMDISDSILDLRQRKVWKRKYSEEELEKAREEQEDYKKWIEDNLLHGSLDDLIQSVLKTESD